MGLLSSTDFSLWGFMCAISIAAAKPHRLKSVPPGTANTRTNCVLNYFASYKLSHNVLGIP